MSRLFMNTSLKKILVIGGNGFIGSSVCKAALARGIQVTSVSSSGRPYQTNKGHTPAWVSKVCWRKGDALQPETFAHLFPDVDGVVHTLGTFMEDGQYKQALREGNLLGLASSFCRSTSSNQVNPLEKTSVHAQKGSYQVVNYDTALRVCEAFISSIPSADHVQNTSRPFIYISAEDLFHPIVSGGYIETKRKAELGIEALIADNPNFRGVYIRPSLVYHAHHRPLTTPIAALLDFSATLHSKISRAFPTPASVLKALSAQFPHSAIPLDSIANTLEIPPIHVDHVAEAICVALDSSRLQICGVVGVRQMRELIGWSGDT